MSRVGWIRLTVILGALGLFELLCRAGVIPAFTVIAPSDMARALWSILQSGKFTPDIKATLANVAFSIVLSVCAGVLAGTLLQSLPPVRRVLDPLFATYYSIPMYAFYPLLIVA